MVQIEVDADMPNNPSSGRIRFETNNLDLILALILYLKFVFYRWYIHVNLLIKRENKKPT